MGVCESILYIFLHVDYDKRMNPIDFLGQRSRSQWTYMEQDRDWTVMCIYMYIKLGRHVNHDKRTACIICIWTITYCYVRSGYFTQLLSMDSSVYHDLDSRAYCHGQGQFAYTCSLIHFWVTDIKCVKSYPDRTWQWGVVALTRIFCMCALWPWHWRYDLTDFLYVRTVTLTLEIWPWVKVMTHPWDMDNNCVNYPDPTWQWGVMARTQIFGMFDLGDMTLDQSYDASLCYGQLWNVIQIQLGSEDLWPGHWFQEYVHCDLGDMTLVQGQDTSWGHGQQLCEISRSIFAVRSYGPDTDFKYMCTLTLEIWPWVKVMTHPWVMNNKCVKYPDRTWQWGVMDWTRIFGMCAQLPWQYDLGSRSWNTLRLWIIVWNIQIQLGSEMARTRILAMCALWPWVKVRTPLGHGQQLCEISRLDKGGGIKMVKNQNGQIQN